MFCHKCGTEIPDDSELCRKCGQRLTVVTSATATGAAIAPARQETKPKETKSLVRTSFVIAGVLLLLVIIGYQFNANVELKRKIAEETLVPGASVAPVATERANPSPNSAVPTPSSQSVPAPTT